MKPMPTIDRPARRRRGPADRDRHRPASAAGAHPSRSTPATSRTRLRAPVATSARSNAICWPSLSVTVLSYVIDRVGAHTQPRLDAVRLPPVGGADQQLVGRLLAAEVPLGQAGSFVRRARVRRRSGRAGRRSPPRGAWRPRCRRRARRRPPRRSAPAAPATPRSGSRRRPRAPGRPRSDRGGRSVEHLAGLDREHAPVTPTGDLGAVELAAGHQVQPRCVQMSPNA